MAGYNLPKKDGLATVLSQKLKEEDYDINVIDGSVSGDTTGAGRTRLGWMIKQHQPDVIVMGLGANDMLRGLNPQITRENVTAMVEMILDKDIKLAFTAVKSSMNYGIKYANKFNGIYPEIADKYDLDLHKFLLEDTFRKPGLMLADNIHPSAKGVIVIADELIPFLKQYLE